MGTKRKAPEDLEEDLAHLPSQSKALAQLADVSLVLGSRRLPLHTAVLATNSRCQGCPRSAPSAPSLPQHVML